LHEEEPKDRRWREAGADEAVNWPRESRSLEPRLRMWARVAKAERAAENATRELEEYHLRLSYSQQDVERTTAQLVEIAAQLQAEIARNSALEAERIQAAKANTVVQAATTLQHEINNPLFAVTGSAESLLKRLRMLEDKGLPEAAELIARAERVLKGAECISQVVKAFSNVLVPTTTDYLPGVPMLQIYQEEAA
jgi:signal transduction histidine kinase